jgi:uncharacterized protein
VHLPVTWADIATPEPPAAESRPLAVFTEGHGKGGATFSRLEGASHGSGKFYVHATDGGDARLGQVWEYTPGGRDRGVLRLPFDPPKRRCWRCPTTSRSARGEGS